MTSTTIYLDTVVFVDDDGVVRATITDGKGNEIEVIACPPRFVTALTAGQKFWAEFQRKRAEADAKAHIESLPAGKKRVRG